MILSSSNVIGGKVSCSAEVVQVLWGAGNYLPQVSSSTTPSVASLFQQTLSNGALSSWCKSVKLYYLNLSYFMAVSYRLKIIVNSEYKTPTQTINTGSFVGIYTITPSAVASGTSITDDQIKTELLAQIGAGNLPAPTLDSLGNPRTYYAIFFPPGKSISLGTSTSCTAGGFCAYHSTVAATVKTNELYYGVHPDMQSGTGGLCAGGCGSGTTFQNYCSVASHELVEFMTSK